MTHRGFFLLSLLFATTLCTRAAEFVFDTAKDSSEHRLRLEDLDADFPRDWSGYEALVLEMRASSSQRFNLRIYSGEEKKFSRVLLQPYPGVWLRAAIPVAMLTAAPTSGHDMASVGNRSRPGYYLGLWGPFVPLTAVHALSFTMEKPIGSPRLEIRSIRVTKQSPGDAVLEPLPLVDEFGQWIHADWAGKVKSLEDLQSAWKQEAASLASATPELCQYGGYANTQAKATGFFRVEQREGRWWFVDPDGHLFLSTGCDVIQPNMVTRLAGRESYFRELPPEAVTGDRGPNGGVSFLTANLVRRFGNDWRAPWVDFTLRRMSDWGFNTVANWSDSGLWRAARKPYVIPLGRWDTGLTYLGLPDVFSEDFSRQVDAAARRQCESHRADPWLLGYFVANEPPFPQKELQTVDLILSGPATATQKRLRTVLAERGDSPAVRKQFIEDAFDVYIQVTSRAIKKYDPNHLNLGMRSGGRPTDSEIRVSRAFDVYSVNVYDNQVSADRMKQITALTGRPVIIGEFHFGVPERGLAASLVQVRDQHERGVAYRYYVEQAFAMPGLIGTHWFQWADQPATGRFDGENYSIGLVDVTDRPYLELIQAARTTHRRLQDVHAGREQAFSGRAVAH